MADVIIIGAGITGLACGWRLKRLGIDAQILESSNRPGGVIESERVGDYLIERGPNSLLPSAENFQLLDESGLTNAIMEGDPRAPRYVYIGKSLRTVPFGPLTIGGLLRAVAEPFIRSRSTPDESIHDFFTRRIGREAEERLVSPFVTGIYAGDTRQLSMAATFPKFTEMERQHGSLVVGMMKSRKPKGTRRGHTCSFMDGMESLPRRLAKDLDIVYNVEETVLSRNLPAKAVVVTTPAHSAIKLIESALPQVAAVLKQVEYAPMVIATTSISDSAFPKPLRGFGFLVPRTEKLHLLGTLFSSALFSGRAPRGTQLLTSFIGGALEREALDWPDDRVSEVVRTELHTILKTSAPPELLRIVRRTHAIPQYKIGHERLISALKNEIRSIPGLFLAGNYTDGVSVSACMETGERIARETAAFLGEKP